LVDIVHNNEKLYRSVRADTDCVRFVGSLPQVSASAFNDRFQKPSVDRANLRTSPKESRKSISDGVILLCTTKIRQIDTIQVSPNIDGGPCHAFDVIHRPEEPNEDLPRGNCAHAQIEPSPQYETKSRFKKLKEALAQIANVEGWAIQPTIPSSTNQAVNAIDGQTP